ncbi:O-antigen ligase family protein [Bacillus sp. ISL-47]|uniref:O-antigen ligase family protein n=1 Tax=Bacillus sp. ISL-47 TaxID=2819130 RepID=UPI001BE72D3E|nr:O-antigen ligase family protein [Bacillus sp. ISL-47]MBT2689227.1 O-antigen ligase family protein [Bacillus sp. ISL-47]MBT2708652.1 O-antigen ligase family protein [Pseudomonas sp. ISL-84]
MDTQYTKLNITKGGTLKEAPFFLWIIIFIYIYSLFAFSRVKALFSFSIEGMSTTNEIWLLPLLCLLIFLNKRFNFYDRIYKYNIKFLILIFMYIFIIAIGGFHTNSLEQFFYAGLLFIVPMLIFFPISRCKSEHIAFLIKFFIVICLIYAILTILVSTNFTFFMNLVGNEGDIYQNNTQVRAPMMLGSSIAVSYYFNLTLPLCFYMYMTSFEKKWRIISGTAIMVIIVATFMLLSRAASICMIFIIFYYVFFISTNRKKLGRKLLAILLIIVAVVYAYLTFDLTRILEELNFSGNSAKMRIESSNLGIYIFTQFPIFGSGIGRFFERKYENSYITVDGIGGLIDPHNMYVLILSELGIVGLIITLILFFNLFRRFSYIKDKILRKTAFIILLAFLFDALGGSHLFINISFATIFWMYMGLFNAVYIKGRQV